MAEKVVFARARPREIQIYEDYFYEATLASQPLIRPQSVPEGKIAVIIPYDGQQFFSRDARNDVQKVVEQAAKMSRSDMLSARIGYLAIGGFEQTDLDEVIRLSEHDNLLPLDIPVYGGVLNGVDALADHRHVCQLELAYQPSLPELLPVSVSVEVSDEDTLRAERSALAGAVDEAERTEAMFNLARRIGQHEAFLRTLTLRFSVKLHLSRRLTESVPQIKRVALTWPVATTYRNLSLSLSERPGKEYSLPIHYKRETKTIEWEEVEMLGPGGAEQGTAPFQYRAPEMSLHVAQPDVLLGESRLRGEITIEIPAPLSGGRVYFFNALGEQEEVALKGRSRLQLRFNLDVLDCFGSRLFSPSQQLQFPGVLLNETHLSDIKSLLRAEGFTLAEESKVSFGDGVRAGYLLAFHRTEGAGQLRLWVRVDGLLGRTLRQEETGDGENFTTVGDSASMVIYLRTELAGTHQRSVQALNEAHRLLKDWFQPLKTLR